MYAITNHYHYHSDHVPKGSYLLEIESIEYVYPKVRLTGRSGDFIGEGHCLTHPFQITLADPPRHPWQVYPFYLYPHGQRLADFRIPVGLSAQHHRQGPGRVLYGTFGVWIRCCVWFFFRLRINVSSVLPVSVSFKFILSPFFILSPNHPPTIPPCWIQKREGFNIAALFTNPMFIVMGISAVMLLVMPKMMDSVKGASSYCLLCP